MKRLFAGLALLLLMTPSLDAQIRPSEESLSDLYPGKAYSPYAERSFPTFPLWGETHLHTGYSLDAGLFGNRLLHEEAYRFARGEEIRASSGQPVKLSRPLDFLVVADHAENLGLAPMIAEANPELLRTEFGREIFK